MKVFVSKAGALKFNKKQQVWYGDDPDVMQQSTFAGHEMLLLQESDERRDHYILRYLGFDSEAILGIDSAKAMAAEFAKAVLAKMAESVR